jgi:hypothetical protein
MISFKDISISFNECLLLCVRNWIYLKLNEKYWDSTGKTFSHVEMRYGLSKISPKRKNEKTFVSLISICDWVWKRESIKIKAETKSSFEIWFGFETWLINISMEPNLIQNDQLYWLPQK